MLENLTTDHFNWNSETNTFEGEAEKLKMVEQAKNDHSMPETLAVKNVYSHFTVYFKKVASNTNIRKYQITAIENSVGGRVESTREMFLTIQ